MKWLFLLLPMLCLGQKVEYYEYGYGGMVKGSKTRVFCDSLARPEVRYEVIDSIISRYNKKLLEPGILAVPIKSGFVLGQIIKRQGDNLLVYVFVYEKVVYHNGLIQIYRKPKSKK